METALGPDARRALLTGAREALGSLPSCPPAAIPVSAEGWQSALTDAGLTNASDLLRSELVQLREAAAGNNPDEMRQAASALVVATASIANDLWCIAAMRPSGSCGTVAFRDALVGVAVAGIDAVTRVGPDSDVLADQQAIRDGAARLLARTNAPTSDAFQAAFGVSRTALSDAHGVVSLSRLLATYYGRYGELQERLRVLLFPITDAPPSLLDALHPAEALLVTPRPLLTVRTAVGVRALLDAELDADAERATRPLRHLKLRIDRSASSHLGIVRTSGALDDPEVSDADRAALTLELYRKMVEGQLRPWAWALLQIRGRSGSRAPELSSLRDQLLADGHPLLLDAAAAILPAARNAAAHEDFLWDQHEQVLVVGERSVSLDQLTDASERAYAFMCGAECAWACARAESQDFARLLDRGDPPEGLQTLDEHAALAHFGTNGLRVRDWRHERKIFSVTLDELPSFSINPCFQAALWASRCLSITERFQVKLPHLLIPAMDLSREVLDATFVVWRQARATFHAMPVSTFLPANAWARLAVELPEEAALATAWLAVNDAMHAYEETREKTDQRLGLMMLAHRLDLIGAAVAATMAVLPPMAVAPLREVLDLAGPAATWSASAARGLTPGPASELERRIAELHDKWPTASILPTVDARPLE